MVTVVAMVTIDAEYGSWIGNLDDIFQVCQVTTSSDVLSSELAMCRELLQLEPDNKCMCMKEDDPLLIITNYRVSVNNFTVVRSYRSLPIS